MTTSRGILFNTEMASANWRGLKTQTRRPIALRDFTVSTTRGYAWEFRDRRGLWNSVSHERLLGKCPYGVVGDRLWQRETFSTCALDVYPFPKAWYRADFTKHDDPVKEKHILGCNGRQGDCWGCAAERGGKFKWTPSIHMPVEMSRISFTITDVRVQRLKDISDADVKAEGVPVVEVQGRIAGAYGPPPKCRFMPAAERFAERWDAVYGNASDNPFVWAITYRRA